MYYEKMYAVLCGACSEAIDALERQSPEEARTILQDALLQAEEMFVSDTEGLTEEN